MNYIEGKAYVDSIGRLFVWTGARMFSLADELPVGEMKRDADGDCYAKELLLLYNNTEKYSENPTHQLPNGTIIKTYYYGKAKMGIVYDGVIYYQDGSTEIFTICSAWEKIRTNSEAKKLFVSVYEKKLEQRTFYSKIDELSRKAKNIENEFGFLNEEIMNAFGMITKRKFMEIFMENLSNACKGKIKFYCYEATDCTCFGCKNDEFFVYRAKTIQKWSERSFVKHRYDYTAYIDDSSAAAKREIEGLINRNSALLPTEKKHYAKLDIGDKDTLYLYEGYKVKIPEFTMEAAIKLAEEF